MVNAIRAAIIESFNEQFTCFNWFEGWWTWLWNDSLMKRIRLVCFIPWTIVGKKSRVELEGCRWNEKIKRWNRKGIRSIVQMKCDSQIEIRLCRRILRFSYLYQYLEYLKNIFLLKCCRIIGISREGIKFSMDR